MSTICIDAGHGYNKTTGLGDVGAVNGSRREADVTLIVAKKVTNRLRNAGYKVVMTRNDDRALTLQRRCDVSNDYGADLFVSIHANSSADKTPHGIETFHAKVCQATSKRLATNIQSELVKVTGARDRGVKSENFYVLRNTKAPATLVELGFISNDDECAKLFETSYQDKLAHGIVKGITETLK